MTLKKKPQRTCLGCRTAKNKNELIRIVRTPGPDGTVTVDPTGKANGRGAYLCRDTECLKKALKAKALQRALKTDIPEDIGERLMKEIADEKE